MDCQYVGYDVGIHQVQCMVVCDCGCFEVDHVSHIRIQCRLARYAEVLPPRTRRLCPCMNEYVIQ